MYSVPRKSRELIPEELYLSQLLVQKYLNDLSDLRRTSGSHRESVVREAFKTLLKEWGKSDGLLFIPEYEHITAMEERRYVDGALVEPQLRLPMGYWEAKDTNDDLDAEIAKKFRRGYPQDNIIFEDSERGWSNRHSGPTSGNGYIMIVTLLDKITRCTPFSLMDAPMK
jgi:hypothetical protein